MAREGGSVGVNFHSTRGDADKLVATIRRDKGEAIALKGDVCDEGEVGAMFESFLKAFGRVDILVANAGIQKDAPVADLSLDDWNAVIATNVTGQFLCAREA